MLRIACVDESRPAGDGVERPIPLHVVSQLDDVQGRRNTAWPHRSHPGGHLRWADLDLDAGRAAIRQTVIVVNHEIQLGQPKTAKGTRKIEMDAATVATLREHRKRQAAERLLVGGGWVDHGLVFCQPTGIPLHAERVSEAFTRRVRKAGLPMIRLHDLRHTWATLALGAGIHPKVVQERLGHANISVTSTSTAMPQPRCIQMLPTRWPASSSAPSTLSVSNPLALAFTRASEPLEHGHQT